MALFPRFSSGAFGPTRHELGPFFNLFNDTFSELQKLSDNAARTFSPKFDVKELKDTYLLEGELPGIEQKDITIEFVDDQTLTIKGRTESYREEGERSPTEDSAGSTESTEAKTTTSDSQEVAKTGSKEVTKAAEGKHTYWVSERSVGEFARSFAFPNRVDQDHVKASLKNGILSVTVPKLQKVNQARKIQIE